MKTCIDCGIKLTKKTKSFLQPETRCGNCWNLFADNQIAKFKKFCDNQLRDFEKVIAENKK